MPGANGLWLADQIRDQHPTTAIVLATADADIPPTESLRSGIVAYLVKPFRRNQVTRAAEEGIRWSAHIRRH
jgi:response regulator of citrate/malate metabolism